MKRTTIILMTLVVGLFAWLYMGRWTEKYQEQNVRFRVSGEVLDVSTKQPLADLEVNVWYREAKTSEHKLRGKPIYSTNYLVTTGEQGVFNAEGFGGSFQLMIANEGFEEFLWGYNTSHGRAGFDTNLVIELVPK